MSPAKGEVSFTYRERRINMLAKTFDTFAQSERHVSLIVLSVKILIPSEIARCYFVAGESIARSLFLRVVTGRYPFRKPSVVTSAE